jgi:hypothetical protein
MKKYSLLLLFVILSLNSCCIDRVHAAEVDLRVAETQTCDAGSSTQNNGTCSAADAPDEQKSSGDNKKYPECGIYIAKSTIQNAGMGIFTAEAKKPMILSDPGTFASPTLMRYQVSRKRLCPF